MELSDFIAGRALAVPVTILDLFPGIPYCSLAPLGVTLEPCQVVAQKQYKQNDEKQNDENDESLRLHDIPELSPYLRTKRNCALEYSATAPPFSPRSERKP